MTVTTVHQEPERRFVDDRRRRRLALRFPDRRRGFDRRRPRSGWRVWPDRLLRAYRDHPRALPAVLASILVLNGLDLLLTLRAVARGAGEANPIMRWMLDAGPAMAAAFKLAVASSVVASLWLTRRYRPVLGASILLLAALLLVTVYHLLGPLVMAG